MTGSKAYAVLPMKTSTKILSFPKKWNLYDLYRPDVRISEELSHLHDLELEGEDHRAERRELVWFGDELEKEISFGCGEDGTAAFVVQLDDIPLVEFRVCWGHLTLYEALFELHEVLFHCTVETGWHKGWCAEQLLLNSGHWAEDIDEIQLICFRCPTER
jgi:hypothetical protein